MQKELYKLSAEDTIKELKSNRNGISENEAKERLKLYGANELKEKKKKSSLIFFLEQFKSAMIIILIIATIILAAFGETMDAIVILIIIFLNAGIGFYQGKKAEKAIEALKRMASQKAVVMRQGKETEIFANELVPGDVISLEVGKKVPADARIIEAMNLKADESMLTGESVPVDKHSSTYEKDTVLAERKNMLFSGTTIVYGRCKAIVTSTGMKTEMGRIAELIQEDEGPTILQKRLEKLGRQLGIAIVAICAIMFVFGFLRGYALFETFFTAVTLAVAAIPEGMPAIVAISLALGVQKMAKRNAIVRRLHSVETLGCTTVICSDKTGTLTVNQMTARKLWINDKLIDITGDGYKTDGGFLFNGEKYKMEEDTKLLLEIGLLCNDAKLHAGAVVGDPTEAALVVAALKGIHDVREKHKRIDEIPFDSARKTMTTINLVEGKKVANIKGAPEILLEKSKYMLVNGSVRPLGQKDKEKILQANNDMTKSAMRVLGFAFKELPNAYKRENVERDLIFVGMIGSIDPPRKEAKESIGLCKQAGIRVVMITGDHKNTAVAIAKEIGLYDKNSGVLTGEEIDKLSDEELFKLSRNVAVFARVSPEHKIRIVDAVKRGNNVAAMIGDGVNDVPALKRSDIAVSVGSGTDVAKDVSDMILLDDNFHTIVAAIEEGRGIYDNIKRSVNYLLSCNVGEVLTIFIAILMNLPSPLIPIQILWMNLVTDSLPALALGASRADHDVMQRRPRSRNEKILNMQSIRFIGIVGVMMFIGTLLIFASVYNGDYVRASTMAFTALIIVQMSVALSARSERYSFIKTGIKHNKKLLLAIAISIMLQLIIIYTPFFNTIFSTVPLNIAEWGVIILFSVIVFAVLESIKIFRKEFF